MVEKIEIVNLYEDGVTIRKQKTYTEDNVEYKVGLPICKSYSNSISGRDAIGKEVVEPFLSAILAVWGSSPTVVSKEPVDSIVQSKGK